MTGSGAGCLRGHGTRPDRPCAACRRERVLARVIAGEPSLSAEQVAAVFDAAVTTGAALRQLELAFEADPDVLGVGAPQVVGRLVAGLVAAGSTTWPPPTCAVCHRSGRRLYTTPHGGLCSRCAHQRRRTACSRCGGHKPVAARDDEARPLCERCRRQVRGRRRCGLCGQHAAIAVRARDGRPDVCVNCYRLPETVCVRCGRRRPCNFADTHQPTCQGCAPRATAACARCGAQRPPTARWPEGPVCESCYRTALHRRGPCAGCGQQRRLVDPSGSDASRCADCAGVDVPGRHVCDDCGIEDRLFERGRCARCSLRRRTAELLAGGEPTVPAALTPICDAIAAARQPYSALNWLRTGAAAALLGEVATGRLAATHDALDAHPRPRAADYLRRMLVAHGLLDERDDELARTQRWVVDLLAGIDRPADRRIVSAYASWRVLRRLRHRADRNAGPWTATRTARNQLAAAAALLDWLAAHGRTLDQADQAHIDAWLTTGPSAYRTRDFVGWAAQHGHCRPLEVPTTVTGTGTAMDPQQRFAVLARLLHDDTVELTDRVAGSLLLCYAQPLSRITAITLQQITRDGDTTTIRFGGDQIVVPQPLAGLLCDLIDTPRRYVNGTGAPTSPWLFPGLNPGRPLTPARLGARLRELGIDARAARRAALIHLAAQLPAAVLADLLDITPGTAVRWVNDAGGTWSRYAAALATERDHTTTE